MLTRDKNVECTISSEQNVSNRPTLISLAILHRVKFGRFWFLSGRWEMGAEIRELPENTGDLATVPISHAKNCSVLAMRCNQIMMQAMNPLAKFCLNSKS